jgi:hypothetical protein
MRLSGQLVLYVEPDVHDVAVFPIDLAGCRR